LKILNQLSQLQKSLFVIPSKDGIQALQYVLDPGFMNMKLRFRRNDSVSYFSVIPAKAGIQ
jgi:hypothetical protein